MWSIIILASAMVVSAVIVAMIFLINPIAKAEFSGGSPNEAEIMAAIKRVQRLDYEVEITIDDLGETLSCTESPESARRSVGQTALFRVRGDLTQIHNHLDGLPPSVDDLKYAAAADFVEMVVVTPQWIYRIPRPKDGWSAEYEIEEVAGQHSTIRSPEQYLMAVLTELKYSMTKKEVKN